MNLQEPKQTTLFATLCLSLTTTLPASANSDDLFIRQARVIYTQGYENHQLADFAHIPSLSTFIPAPELGNTLTQVPAQWITTNPDNGDIFILVPDLQKIVQVKLNGTESDIHLSSELGNIRGIAFNPVNDHLYAINPDTQTLYKINQSGELIAHRDLSPLGFINPQGILFAPSGDTTDADSVQNLYLTDSGIGKARLGASKIARPAEGVSRIIELSIHPPPRITKASTVTATLIQTIDTASFNPISPDSSAITYLNNRDNLLLADSEVSETPYFGLDNLFELSLQGGLLNMSTIITHQGGVSNEPTGLSAINPANQHLFVSDDDQHKIFELDLGGDGIYGTADDQVVHIINTLKFKSIDPEGVAFNARTGTLYVADGNNSEVYIIAPGSNGSFGDEDDIVTHFDTFSLGLADPEGITYSTLSDHLFIVGEPGHLVFELTTQGVLVRTIDISSVFTPGVVHNPSGLTFAPDSRGSFAQHLYICDRGIDNDWNPAISNDGLIYEVSIPATEERKVITTPSLAEERDVILSRPPPQVEVGQSIIETRIKSSSDDAEEKISGQVKLTSSDLKLVLDRSNQTVGMRFTNLNIPQGAIIQNAWIQFQTDETDAGNTHLTIRGQAINHASTFSSNTGNVSSRSTTSSSIAWHPANWVKVGERGSNQKTPNIAAIIQEIVNRSGWSVGNALAIIVNGTGQRTAESFDGQPTAAPLLHIEYKNSL